MAPVNIFIFEPYPFAKVSGNLRTLSYIFGFIDRKKFNLILLSPFESDFINNIRKQDIECIVASPPRRIGRYGGKCLKDNWAGRLLTILLMIPYNIKLRSIIRRKKIDLIYCNCIRAVLCIALAAKLSRTPMLWYIKGELQNKILDRVGFILSDKILFQCESNKNDKYSKLVKRYKNKIGILEGGIDPETIIEAERKNKIEIVKELSITNKNINIIVSGQLSPLKGVHYLLEALIMLINKFPNLRLYIMGHPIIDEYKSYQDELMNIIKNNNLENNIIFTGWRTDALEVVSLMDILVHPSLSEGFARAVVEAMALGKPVVASKVGTPREVVRDGKNGFLVEPKNPQALAEKISILLEDKNLRDKFGQSARETVFSNYLIQDKIAQLEGIWSGMIFGKVE